jgi:hypothetical protein
MAAMPQDTTFRDPEHGGKSVPLSEDVQRKPTGTTAMGDPYTGDEMSMLGGFPLPGVPGAAISGSGVQPLVDLANQQAEAAAESSGEGETPEGEEGMMINAAKGAMVPHDPMGGFAEGADMPGEPSKGYEQPKPSRKPKFEEGGFNVMDPRDFLTMLRDERKAKNSQRKAPGPRKNK